MADVAGVSHHLVLNGVGYMLRRGKSGLVWKRGEAPFLVPRQGGALSRDVLSRPEVSSGYLGAGYGLEASAGKYARGQGIDARLDGPRAAASQAVVSGGGVQWSGGVDLASVEPMFAGANGSASRVYRYSLGGGTMAEQTGLTAAGQLTFAFQANNTAWFCVAGGGANCVTVVGGGAAAAAGSTNGAAVGARDSTYGWLALGAGASQKVMGASLKGLTNATGWTASAAFAAGDVVSAVQGMFSYQEKMYLARRDGVYQLGWDMLSGSVCSQTRVLENRNFQLATAYGGWVEFSGAMYFLLADRVWRWTGGATYTEVSPPNFFVSTSGEGTIALAVRSLSAGKGWLWALAESDESPAGVYLLAYNGARWEMVRQVVAGSGALAGGVHASGQANKVFANAYNGSTWSTYKMDLNTFGDRPAAGAGATGNYCYLPGLDGGLPGESKLWRYVSIRGSGFSAQRPVGVEYWNGSTWVSAGSVNLAYGGTVTIPNGGYVDTRLIVRLDLQTDGVMSGAVREVSAGYVVLPDPIPMTEFEVLLGPVVRKLDGTTEARTPAQLLTALLAVRASGQVAQLADPYTSAQGLSARAVRVQEVEVKAMRPSPNAGGAYGWFAQVRCLDV